MSDQENLARTLADVLPKTVMVGALDKTNADGVKLYAVPKGTELKEVDLERLLPTPRRAKLYAQMAEPDSFLAYVAFHASDNRSTAVWCDFNPATYSLQFQAVFDEHGQATAGWRKHRARCR